MGIIVGLFAALSASALDVFLKKLSGANPNFLTWIRSTSALPVLAVFVTIFGGWKFPPLPFWVLLVCVITPLEVALGYLSTKSLHLSPISLVGPLTALTSVFLIPVGFVILGELPSLGGLFGILYIVVGSLLLSWQSGKKMYEEMRKIVHDRGAQLAVLGAFVASIAISVTKLLFGYASPLFTAFCTVGAMSLLLTVMLSWGAGFRGVGKTKHIIGVGVSSGAGIALHNVGLSLLPAAYFVSIKRLSLLINVLSGKYIFNEGDIRGRLTGAVLMVVGVALIAIG